MDQPLQQVSISSTTKVIQFLSSPMLFIVFSIRYSVTLSVITAFITDIRIQQNRFYIIHDTTYTLYLNQPIKKIMRKCQHLQMLHPFQIVEQNSTGNAYYKMKIFETRRFMKEKTSKIVKQFFLRQVCTQSWEGRVRRIG
jgi:hypothetical protein